MWDHKARPEQRSHLHSAAASPSRTIPQFAQLFLPTHKPKGVPSAWDFPTSPGCPGPGYRVGKDLSARTFSEAYKEPLLSSWLPRGTGPSNDPRVSPFVFCSFRGLSCWWMSWWRALQPLCPCATTERRPVWNIVNVTWFKFCKTQNTSFLMQKV